MSLGSSLLAPSPEQVVGGLESRADSNEDDSEEDDVSPTGAAGVSLGVAGIDRSATRAALACTSSISSFPFSISAASSFSAFLFDDDFLFFPIFFVIVFCSLSPLGRGSTASRV